MNSSRPPARRRATTLPCASSGLGSVIAICGTGRLERLLDTRRRTRPAVDRFGYVAGLERGVASLRTGQP
jgi:hypothetical protein